MYQSALAMQTDDMSKEESIEELIPLPDSQFYILWALADGAHHGYAIMRHFDHHQRIRARLGSGVLNRNLPKMTDLGLVETTEESSKDERGQVYYRLTNRGGRALLAQLQFMNEELGSATKVAKKLQHEAGG